MLAIFKRDFRSYLHSFIGPLAVTVILIFMMIFFAVNNMIYGYSVINGALYGACLYGITFSMPILCMRTFAEERRSRTDQMILTAPVSIAGIVIGKFMALVAVLAVPAGLACFLPLVLGKYGDVPYKWSYTCVLAFILYGMMIISLCMFMSSLVENPIIAAVFSLIVSFLGILLPGAYTHIPIEWLRKFLDSTYNFTDRLADLMMGTLDWTSVIYFVSLTLLFLFLCTQVIEKRRYSLKKGMYSAGIYSGSLIIICVAAVIAINVSSAEFPETVKNIDVSGTGMYSLSKDSKDILNNMTDDVAIYYLAKENDTEGEKDVDVERILKLYAGTGKHVSFSYVDTTISPDFAKQYTDNELSYNSVIVVDNTTGRSRAVDYYDMTIMGYDSNYQPFISGYDIEGQVTGAIQYVMLSSDQLLNAYCVIGHDELSFDPSYDRVFTNYSVNLHDIDLKTVSEIPEDCDLLIINTPESDYMAEEVSLIKDYLDKGGDIVIMTFYAAPNMNNFSELLSYYGVEKKPGLVVKRTSRCIFTSSRCRFIFIRNSVTMI
jgi:ABC-2 type transport system permease protein